MRLLRWRLRDAEFFVSACASLRARQVWPAAVWEYALLHGKAAEVEVGARRPLGLWGICRGICWEYG